MSYTYSPKGVCAKKIEIELDGEIIKSVNFTGGCNGNTQGISKLVVGQNINDVISRLQGTVCGSRDTSCPDQLAKALQNAKENM